MRHYRNLETLHDCLAADTARINVWCPLLLLRGQVEEAPKWVVHLLSPHRDGCLLYQEAGGNIPNLLSGSSRGEASRGFSFCEFAVVRPTIDFLVRPILREHKLCGLADD